MIDGSLTLTETWKSHASAKGGIASSVGGGSLAAALGHMSLRTCHLEGGLAHGALRLGFAALALALFVALTHELQERDVDALDRAILLMVGRLRRGWLNGVAVDVTALGSITVITLFTVVALLVLLAVRDRVGAARLMTASIGAGVLTALTKGFIERPRPSVIPPLVQVTGFSYPSGHSLGSSAVLLTVALLGARHLPSTRGRALLLAALALVILLIASSRVYLGVHHPSDVASGVLLGAAWALLLHAGFAIRTVRPSA